jgi:hypothetical protein
MRPETADASALQETYFVVPVRFRVDGVDLLSRPAPANESGWVGEPDGGPIRANEARITPDPDVLEALAQATGRKARRIHHLAQGRLARTRATRGPA